MPLYTSYTVLMIGSDSIDLSLENIWESWFAFRRGKRASLELHRFQYYLERNLCELFVDLNRGMYRHGDYRKFIVSDNKRREVSVAHIRDRVVHRIIYDFLNSLYDKTFIYDAWSCRKGKGLIGAIQRAQSFMARSPDGWVWKGDIRKFFDSVDPDVLLRILSRKIKDEKTFELLREVIGSFSLSLSLSGEGAACRLVI